MNANPPPSARLQSSGGVNSSSVISSTTADVSPISPDGAPLGEGVHGGVHGGAHGGAHGGSPMPNPAPPLDAVVDPRWEMLRERLRTYGPTVGYVVFFFWVFLLSVYLSFPYERIRDRIVAEFDKTQRNSTSGRQVLSIGSLSPRWFTGVVLSDVRLLTFGPDATKPPTSLHLDEVRLRVGLLSVFSTPKDVWFSAKAFGGTIEGSMVHRASVNKESESRTAIAKNAGPRYDSTLKLEMSDVGLRDIAMVREAVGADVGGTLKGSLEITYVEGRSDRSNGDAALEIEGFWVSDGVHPFKIPAMKAVFGSDEITLPQISIGDVPITVAIRNGVAKIEKMEAKGKDLDLSVDGQVTLRDPAGQSELNLGLRFKFNESYQKKSDSTAGLLMALDSEPKLRASKRSDGTYSLRVIGLLSGVPQVIPAPGAPGGGGGMRTP